MSQYQDDSFEYQEEDLIPSERFRGVWRDEGNDCWIARVETENGWAFGGWSFSENQAAHFYDRSAMDLLPGEPTLNFPEEDEI